MKKLRIFITGASGFVGRNILEQLGSKYEIAAPTHSELDLLDFGAVEKFFKEKEPFHLVIHTAVFGGNRKIPSTAEITNVNLRMFFNIVRCDKYFKKMVFLGSGIEYGKEKPIKLVSENDFDRRVPQDGFGFYKYLCGKYIESCDNIINLRLFGVWGKYEDHTIRFISNAICKTLFGLPITINQNVYFDYLFVDDFVKILDYFINCDPHYKSYNVGTGKRIDLLTIANKIRMLAGGKSEILVKHPGLGNEYTCNSARLLSEIGGFKFSDFDKSLEGLYRWYKGMKPKLSKEDFLDDHFKD